MSDEIDDATNVWDSKNSRHYCCGDGEAMCKMDDRNT